MKTSKKILSIVLAVMLLVGTVVVGASAETMVFEKAGSKLTYTATAGKEANADGFIEVKPGETVTVSVYTQANYYLGTTGSEIFCWTAGFFNKITADNVTEHNYVNNYGGSPKVIASTSATQLGTGYNKGSHEGYYRQRQYSTDCTSPYDASEATLAYEFTFTVPETAAIGATGEFLMPETCSATVATTSRMRQIYAAVNNSATAYGSTSLGSEYPETIDLTGTILNFQVVSAEVPAVPCDYTALDAAIATAQETDTTNCTSASVAEFNAALAAANAVERDLIVDEAGANQAKIDAAADRLNKAIAGLTKLGACDYSKLDAAINTAVDTKDCTTASVYVYNEALEAAMAVERDMIADEAGENQAKIDAATAALNAAIAGLTKLGTCNYALLDEAIAEALAADTANCTSASVNAFNDALAAAQAIERDLIADEAGVNQSKINAAANALNAAIDGLKKLGNCDYSDLDAAIAAYEAKLADKDLYANWADYEAAYDAAKAVARDMIADEAGANQAAIDNAAAALNAVVLTYKDADYSAVYAAIAEFKQVDTELYTEASVKLVEDAIAAVVYGYDITKQDDVNEMAAAINNAIASLVPLGECDYTALDAAIIAAQAYVTNKSNYTPASWEASGIQSAYSEAFFIYTGDKLIADEAGVNQAKIDAAAKALTDACAKLVPVADKAALAAAIARATALNEDDYTPESWEAADLESALIAADRVYEDADAPQTIVDGMVSAIERSEAKLVKKADKSALAAAIEAAKDLDEADYTPESWEAADLEAVISEAQGVYDDPNASVEDVEVAIDLLEAAAAKLVEKADKSALKAAIDTLPEVAEDEATSETWAAYEEELAKANRVYADDNATQDAVNAAEANLLAAIAAVKALGTCDYTALDAAIALAPAEDAEAYTEETWKAYAAAKAEAEAIERNMIADEAGANQAKIDAAAKALEDAYNALELKPVVAIITNVTPMQEYFEVGDIVEFEYLCSMTGITKIQNVYPSATTTTYTRDDSRVVKITDNGDGTETWTIAVKIFEDSVTAVAKAKLGKVWEENGYSFAYQTKANPEPAEDTEVKSAYIEAADGTIVNKFTTKDTVTVKIMAGPDTLRIRLVTEGGSTSTYTRDMAYQLGDNWVWEITTRRTTAGTYKYDIYTAGSDNKLVDEGTDLTYTVTAPVVVEDVAVKSVTILNNDVAVDSFTTKDTVVVRIVAGPDTLRMRLVSEGGSTTTFTRDKATQDENGNWVWDITTRKTTAATYKFDIYTAGKNNKLVDEGTDLVYTVTAPVVYVGPSTGNDADIVVSATVAKARLLTGDKQTVTVVTDKDALGVRIVDAEGVVYYQTKDTALAVDNGDGTLTWTFDVSCANEGTFTFDVQALYSNQWLSNGSEVTYKVVY